MGRIAVLAENHWQKYLPATYARIKDPEQFFLDLEAAAQQQIDQLADSLEPEPQPGETFQQRAGGLAMAQRDAESAVLREMVLLPAETDSTTMLADGIEPSSTGRSETPEDRELRAAMNDWADAKQELDSLLAARLTPASPETEEMTPGSPTQA